MSSLLISATSKSSGKTLVAVGLAAALRARGLQVQTLKKGPDYIDPSWLTAASGRPCYNLDFNTMSGAEIERLWRRHAAPADITLVEGTKGLHDGVAEDGADSNAALARQLDLAVLLVVDCAGMTRGVAPLVKGNREFDPAVRFAGVIVNRTASDRHAGKVRRALESYTDLAVLGEIRAEPTLSIPERHLGLQPAGEHRSVTAYLDTLARTVARQVDLDAVIAAAALSPAPRPCDDTPATSGTAERVTIGVLRDAAFGFYYPDDLEALQAAGARLLFIDAVNDQRLPEVDGLFIGGGFPETCMQALSDNRSLRAELKRLLAADTPVYAECGGLMYLCRRIRWCERQAEMVGAVDADCVMQARPQGRGLVKLEETAHFPWPGGGPGTLFNAHEFHYSRLENPGESFDFGYRVVRGYGVDGHADGIVQGRLLASFAHLRNTAQSPWASRFVQYVASHVAAGNGGSARP